MSITHQEYNLEIERLAGEVLAEVKEYGGDVYELAHEAVDGHQWIIYYAHNDDVVYISTYPDAWEDTYSREDIGELVVERGIHGARAVQAFCAMLQSLMDEIYQQEAETAEFAKNHEETLEFKFWQWDFAESPQWKVENHKDLVRRFDPGANVEYFKKRPYGESPYDYQTMVTFSDGSETNFNYKGEAGWD